MEKKGKVSKLIESMKTKVRYLGKDLTKLDKTLEKDEQNEI